MGLKNAGATCYMNSVIQQLYMIPSIRNGILAIEGTGSDVDDDMSGDEKQDNEVNFFYYFCSLCKILITDAILSLDTEGISTVTNQFPQDSLPKASWCRIPFKKTPSQNVKICQYTGSLNGTYTNLFAHFRLSEDYI